MDIQTLIDLMKETFIISLYLAAPCLLLGLIVGVLISIFQSVTSIQEQTLVFVPKMLVCIAALVFFLPWMLSLLITYTTKLIDMIPTLVR